MRRFKISGLEDECTQLQTGSLYAIFSPVEKLSIQFALHCINESNDTYFILSDNVSDFFNSNLISHPQITEKYNGSTLFPFTFESLYINDNNEYNVFYVEQNGKLLFIPYIKTLIRNSQNHYDIETPYGYGGPILNTNDKEFIQESWSKFKTCSNSS